MKKNATLTKIVMATILSAVLICGGTLAFGQEKANKFSDLKPDHWAYGCIIEMAEAGILSGYPDGSFRPGGTVTCGEFIKMAAAAADLGSSPAKEGEHWAHKYYNAGLNNFLFSEFDIDKRMLDRPIMRSHMALITSSALKNVREYGDHSALLASIHDVDYRTDYEFEIVKAYGIGILSGYPDGSFRPHGTLTRAEAATVIAGLRKCLAEGVEAVVGEPTGGTEQSAGWNPKPSPEPLISTETFDASVPEGTFMLRMRNEDGDMREEKQQLKELLILHFPGEGEAIWDAFVKFTKMDSGGKRLGICKQYVMDYPVLFNLIGEGYDIRIYPKDYEDEYWETVPGQVNVFFI